MKRALIIAALVLFCGACAFLACYAFRALPMAKTVGAKDAELVWLAREFQLTANQREKIQQLHDGYRPRCMAMCRRIAENDAKLGGLIANERNVTLEIEAALRESAQIRVECRREMLAHIYAVAAVMSPDQAQRYIDFTKTQVLQPGLPHEASTPLPRP
jgi:Spy/CpxP family protein refolding chaperone